MFSWVAIDRFGEKERARDGTFRKQSAGKVLRSDANQLTDDDLLVKLRSFGLQRNAATAGAAEDQRRNGTGRRVTGQAGESGPKTSVIGPGCRRSGPKTDVFGPRENHVTRRFTA